MDIKSATMQEIDATTMILKNSSSLLSNKKIPLYVFEPFGKALTGLAPMTEEIKHTWLMICQSPTAETDVYADESFNTYLFTVPPVMDTSIIDFSLNVRDYSEYLGDFANSNHPAALRALGNNLVTTFGNTINMDTVKKEAVKNKDRWDTIRQYFEKGSKDVQANLSKKKSQPVNDFGFLS